MSCPFPLTGRVVHIDSRNSNVWQQALLCDGEPIPLESITSLRMTLVDRDTNIVINGRDNQDVLNAHDVVVEDGLLRWQLALADITIVNLDTPINGREPHLATFSMQFDGGRERHYEALLLVRRLQSVPRLWEL